MVTTQKANHTDNRTVVTRNSRNRAAVATPTRTRTVVNRYYSGGRYYGGYPYYGGGSTFSIGIGSGYGYGYPNYGYGYGYPTSYGYGSPYYSSGYPNGYGYNGYSTYTTNYANGNVVAVVQQRLARLGYYHGVIDGVAGRRTRAAIAAWEARHGMIADGRLRPEVLRSLGVS